ncbi:MAG TPA: hypothetical protein VET51_10165 [Burkholderiales bacterium]|nr:hypothetical protein [Burkholderiales bacterium]
MAWAAAVAVSGCASGPFSAHLESSAAQVRECAQWYQALDEQIDAAGVRDAQHSRIAGFPYLRVDRPLASLRSRAAASEGALHAYADRMLELDIESRRHEIANLPRSRFEALPDLYAGVTRAQSLRRTRECGRLLRDIDLARPQARGELLAAARVPDDYSTAHRIIGLYWLTRVAFAAGVRRWESGTLARFHSDAQTNPNRVRYAPPAGPVLARSTIAGLLSRAQFDPLGQPQLNERELGLLAAAYAPSFDISITGDHDRFGELRWRREAAVPQVNAAEPAVYVHSAYTRYGERVLLQLVYTMWFSERPARGAADLLAGQLDGIVWRVTLAPDGDPLLYDSIHPCGCFHMFFPTPRARPRPPPQPLEEWAFVPQHLPGIAEDERPVLSIASGTHYLERVGVVRGSDSVVRYVFHSYDALRSIPDMQGGNRSAFGPDGLIGGSERLERFLFWPMGIASAGAMRQWGRQATAFVGRRHFDDADLIERRFELDLAERAR